MRRKTAVHFVEIVPDAKLQRLEIEAGRAVRRLFPDCTRVKLYRTADGKIGCQMQVAVVPGGRKRLEEAYRAVMKVLGEKRGRRAGVKTVQTKLRLPEPVYSALKKAAGDSQKTMSAVVVDSLLARFQEDRRLP